MSLLSASARALLFSFSALLISGCANESGLFNGSFETDYDKCWSGSSTGGFVNCLRQSANYSNFDKYQKNFISDLDSIINRLKAGEISNEQASLLVKYSMEYHHKLSMQYARQKNCQTAALLGGLGSMASSNSYTLAGAVGEGATSGVNLSSKCR